MSMKGICYCLGTTIIATIAVIATISDIAAIVFQKTLLLKEWEIMCTQGDKAVGCYKKTQFYNAQWLKAKQKNWQAVE